MADDELLEEGEDEGGEYQPQAASGLNRIVKILIYVAIAVAGMLLMAFIAYFVGKEAASEQFKEVSSIAVVKPPPPLESFNFTEEFRVNTADQGEAHFIKMKMSLGFEQGNKALSAELAQRTPQLRDTIILILSGKTKADLASQRDKVELREELKASINHLLSEGKVKEVYFTEFIVN